jgi:hypothetical protein
MKHLKIFEEISTSISPDLLGLDGKLLTKEISLNLIEKFFREKNSQSFNHLIDLIRGTQPQFLKDGDFLMRLGALSAKYNIDDPNFMLDGDKALPGEYWGVKKDAMRSTEYLGDLESANELGAELPKYLSELADKLTKRYVLPNENFKSALIKAGNDALNALKSDIKSNRDQYRSDDYFRGR